MHRLLPWRLTCDLDPDHRIALLGTRKSTTTWDEACTDPTPVPPPLAFRVGEGEWLLFHHLLAKESRLARTAVCKELFRARENRVGIGFRISRESRGPYIVNAVGREQESLPPPPASRRGPGAFSSTATERSPHGQPVADQARYQTERSSHPDLVPPRTSNRYFDSRSPDSHPGLCPLTVKEGENQDERTGSSVCAFDSSVEKAKGGTSGIRPVDRSTPGSP
ncbi:MAG TPA: hypothetical protein DEP84_09825 [Chloroflexi bacterium]|nr:hypothetical protein [Chloroflexota bacterium]